MDEIIHDSTDESVSGVRVDKEVSAIFQWSRSEIDKVTSFAHGMKQKIIKETALKLEEKIPIDTIALQIVIQLRDIVSQRLIHECLDEKYKQKYRSENAKKQNKNKDLAAKVPLDEEIAPKVLLDTHGSTLIEPPSFDSPEREQESTGIKLMIFKQHEAMIVDALHKCNTSCYPSFNADGILVSVKPDTYHVDYN